MSTTADWLRPHRADEPELLPGSLAPWPCPRPTGSSRAARWKEPGHVGRGPRGPTGRRREYRAGKEADAFRGQTGLWAKRKTGWLALGLEAHRVRRTRHEPREASGFQESLGHQPLANVTGPRLSVRGETDRQILILPYPEQTESCYPFLPRPRPFRGQEDSWVY